MKLRPGGLRICDSGMNVWSCVGSPAIPVGEFTPRDREPQVIDRFGALEAEQGYDLAFVPAHRDAGGAVDAPSTSR